MFVSLYPYNQLQILQYVKYSKKNNTEKGIASFVTNNVLLAKKTKITTKTKQTKNQT